jgi:hypothetical protein
MTELDFGPPRRVVTMDELDAEVDRQRQLVASGDLRSYGGCTWAWTPGDNWRWVSKFSTWSGGLWPNHSDREKAWKKLQEDLR